MNNATYIPPHAPRRRRPWLIALPLAVVVLAAIAWSGFWFYAAAQADAAIAGWRAREAEAGRIQNCANQSIGGFPFRIEAHCASPTVEFRTMQPPFTLAAKDALIAAQIYSPTLLIGEFAGPLTLAESGRVPILSADWRLAQVSVRGTPQAPERVSIAIDQPQMSRLSGSTMVPLARATHAELHGRMAGGSASQDPVIEAVLRLVQASAPGLHPATARPTDGEIDAVLTGLKDFAPKPWPARLREIAAAGGGIEIKRARLQQDDILVVGAGTLGLTPTGYFEGQLDITVAGLDRLITLLGIDQAVQQYLSQHGSSVDKLASGLDRILPGLGGAVRSNSGGLATIGIAMLGEPREIEGRKGISLPLRFKDGTVFLGPIAVAQSVPIF